VNSIAALLVRYLAKKVSSLKVASQPSQSDTPLEVITSASMHDINQPTSTNLNQPQPTNQPTQLGVIWPPYNIDIVPLYTSSSLHPVLFHIYMLVLFTGYPASASRSLPIVIPFHKYIAALIYFSILCQLSNILSIPFWGRLWFGREWGEYFSIDHTRVPACTLYYDLQCR